MFISILMMLSFFSNSASVFARSDRSGLETDLFKGC